MYVGAKSSRVSSHQAWQGRGEATCCSWPLFLTPCPIFSTSLHLRKSPQRPSIQITEKPLQEGAQKSPSRLEPLLRPSPSYRPKQRERSRSGLSPEWMIGVDLLCQAKCYRDLGRPPRRGKPSLLKGCPGWDGGITRITRSG